MQNLPSKRVRKIVADATAKPGFYEMTDDNFPDRFVPILSQNGKLYSLKVHKPGMPVDRVLYPEGWRESLASMKFMGLQNPWL
jgi:hypothetical protein